MLHALSLATFLFEVVRLSNFLNDIINVFCCKRLKSILLLFMNINSCDERFIKLIKHHLFERMLSFRHLYAINNDP